MGRGFVLGFLVVALVAGPAVAHLRGDASRVPVAVPAAEAAVPGKPPARPPNGDELAMFFCGVRMVQARRAPTCVRALMGLYRSCGLDPSHPKSSRCRRLARRVGRADRAAARRDQRR